MKNSADTPEPTTPQSWPPGMDVDPPLEPVGGDEPALEPVGAAEPALEPVGDEPVLEPVGEEPAVDPPLVAVGEEEPVAEEAAEPAAEEPLDEEPAVEEPAEALAEEPAVEEPGVEEPVAADDPSPEHPAFTVPSADAAREAERPRWNDGDGDETPLDEHPEDASWPVVSDDHDLEPHDEPTAVTTPLDAVTEPTHVQEPVAAGAELAVRDEPAEGGRRGFRPRGPAARTTVAGGRSRDPKLLALVGLLAVAAGIGIYALVGGGGDEVAPAPVTPASQEEPAQANASDDGTTPAPAGSAQPVSPGWSRHAVKAGGFSVDAPPSFDVQVEGTLVVMKAPGLLTAYSVNGKTGTDVKVQTVAGTLLDDYRDAFSLTSSNVGDVESPGGEVDRQVDLSAAGKRKQDGAKQWMGARVVRVDSSVYVVQGFTGENESAKRSQWRDQLRAVAKTIQPL